MTSHACERYVTVLAGWGGAIPLVVGEIVQQAAKGGTNRVLTFKLGGTASLPPLQTVARHLAPPPATAEKASVDRGRVLYQQFCAGCHGDTASAGGVVADLRYSAMLGAPDAWKAVVLDGTMVRNGMVAFSRYLKPDDAETVRAYVIYRAHEEVKRRAETR